MNDEFEPSIDHPEETIRLISAALFGVSWGFDGGGVLNGELALTGFQHAGCEEELIPDSEHESARAAGAASARTQANAAMTP